MPVVVVVGAQWGDEAKGKVVDVLGGRAHLVARFGGGNNAGHTVRVGANEHKFHLLPAAILHPHVVAVIGGGVVVCPKGLLEEVDRTRAVGPTGELRISAAAHVVMPYHRLLDRLQEEARGENRIGTTSRGIGPAYEDKVARIGIRMGEFVQPDRFHKRLSEVLAVKNRLLEMFGEPPIGFAALHREYAAYAERLAGYVSNTDALLQDAVEQGHNVLFEGAQGTFLDLDAGTYPFVTSAHPVAGGACLGTGIGPRNIDRVLGVCKAYTTRVGAGPFPTEQNNHHGERLREQGHEYGTTTGRGRRCGWLDVVVLREAARVNSLSALVVTRLDVLTGFEELPISTAYELNGEVIDRLPRDTGDLACAQPRYEVMPGWSDDIRGARSHFDLPDAARDYLRFIEDATGVPVAMVSLGPERDETIVLRPDLLWD